VVGIIYIARNRENGKVYIGQTTTTLPNRQRAHERDSKNTDPSGYFHRAIKEFGKDQFDWEILDRANAYLELNEKERWWIRFFNSTVPEFGYNTRHGGVGERQEGPLCYRENPTPSAEFAYWMNVRELHEGPDDNFIIHIDSGLIFVDERHAAAAVNRSVEWIRGKLSYRSEWAIYDWVDESHTTPMFRQLLARQDNRIAEIDKLIVERDRKAVNT
jgi:hypothetical protein